MITSTRAFWGSSSSAAAKRIFSIVTCDLSSRRIRSRGTPRFSSSAAMTSASERVLPGSTPPQGIITPASPSSPSWYAFAASSMRAISSGLGWLSCVSARPSRRIASYVFFIVFSHQNGSSSSSSSLASWQMNSAPASRSSASLRKPHVTPMLCMPALCPV